jgi:hypothetical protein
MTEPLSLPGCVEKWYTYFNSIKPGRTSNGSDQLIEHLENELEHGMKVPVGVYVKVPNYMYL